MIMHNEIIDKELRLKIKQNKICFGGNIKLKLYGTLHCKSGKRLKRDNRIFFESEIEAIVNGYRPCGHCMREEYRMWTKDKINLQK